MSPLVEDKPVSVGIIGAGEISRRAHLPVLANMSDVTIDWIYDRSPEKAIALGNAYGIRAIHSIAPHQLPPCDVALLAIPVDVRGQYLTHFSAVGTAVLCEKPFAMDAAEHGDILAGFAPYALGCGFMRRFYRSTILLRRLVTSGMFGPLLKIEISEGNRSKGSGVDSSFLDDPRLGASRGVLMDLGSHSIDLALFISGVDAFNVVSCTKHLDGAVDRHVVADVDLLSNGVSGGARIGLNYGVSWLERQGNRISLQFERLTAWSELSAASNVYLGDPARPSECISLGDSTAGASTYSQAFYLEWRSFIDGLRTQCESSISARSAMLTTSLVERLLWGGSEPCSKSR